MLLPRMSPRMSCCLAILSVLLGKTSTSTVVLPRPPASSGNHATNREKGPQDIFHSTNVERPDTNDYRLVEIELEGADDDIVAADLHGFVNAVLENRQTRDRFDQPTPEVIPRSMLGVRDLNVPLELPEFRMIDVNVDKRVLPRPGKIENPREKLYYLKDGRPKVYVNVRGHSGSYAKDGIDRKIGTRTLPQRAKGTNSPKKFQRTDTSLRLNEVLMENRLNGPSTTENSMITSSELPKQIPAPPSKLRGRLQMTQTTPVQRYPLRRTDILPTRNVSTD